MPTAANKHSVSPPRKVLLEWMRAINFGSIEDLHVEEGEPVLEPPPKIFHEIKFGGPTLARPDVQWRQFLVKAQVIEFMGFMDDMLNGTIARIEIKHGLPFRVIVSKTSPRID